MENLWMLEAMLDSARAHGCSHMRTDARCSLCCVTALSAALCCLGGLLSGLVSALIRFSSAGMHDVLSAGPIVNGAAGTQFTCFTSTKIQILTPEELQRT